MARTTIDKFDSPANTTGYTIANTGEFFGVSPWNNAVSSGSNNGVSWTFSATDLVMIGANTANNANIAFTFVMPESTSQTTYGLTASDVTVNVPSVTGATKSIKMLRVSDIFKDSTNKVSVDTNAAGGYVLVIRGA